MIEKNITDKISALLRSYKPGVHYYRPVPSRYGARFLDYIGSAYGYAFVIEAKRPNRKPTEAQFEKLRVMEEAGSAVFIISNLGDIAELGQWLTWCRQTYLGRPDWWPKVEDAK